MMVYENVKRGDIFYAVYNDDDDADAKGSEQKGPRPLVIIQNDIGNSCSPNIIAAKISSSENKLNKHLPTHMRIDLNKPSVITFEHLCTLSKQRLIMKMGSVPEERMQEFDKKLMNSLGLRMAVAY